MLTASSLHSDCIRFLLKGFDGFRVVFLPPAVAFYGDPLTFDFAVQVKIDEGLCADLHAKWRGWLARPASPPRHGHKLYADPSPPCGCTPKDLGADYLSKVEPTVTRFYPARSSAKMYGEAVRRASRRGAARGNARATRVVAFRVCRGVMC